MDRNTDRKAARTQAKHSHKHKQNELSPRELQIMRLLAAGRSNRQIAFILAISVKTVETHRSRVMRKLKLDSLVSLVHYAVRHGIIHV